MYCFQTVHYSVDASSFTYREELPEKAAVVSDLHNCVYGENNQSLFDAIAKESPDCIFIPGDMVVNASKDNSVAFDFLKRLSELQIPVLYSIGNHEAKFGKYAPERFEDYCNKLRALGIRLLNNEWYAYSEHIRIGGITVPFSCYGKLWKVHKLTCQETMRLLPCENNTETVVLAHNPAYFPVYVDSGYKLVISGHMHGGIVRLPFLGGVISPQFRLFPKYDAGVFRIGDSLMYVSRGLGTHSIKLRINNKPELMILHFR